MRTYRISGWFKQGLERQKFTKEVSALSEKHALERVYSDLGSKHKLKRNQINIDVVIEVKPGETSNDVSQDGA
ncbi:MAG: 50S ribosomal protein L18a [Hadesarchaea archaeon]|nr:MAG: 50S ribosomal protein L18a [Hadesarchaea archaeon]